MSAIQCVGRDLLLLWNSLAKIPLPTRCDDCLGQGMMRTCEFTKNMNREGLMCSLFLSRAGGPNVLKRGPDFIW